MLPSLKLYEKGFYLLFTNSPTIKILDKIKMQWRTMRVITDK